jgi:excisionase family DNA binding protein
MQLIAPDKEILTAQEVAAMLRVTPRTVHNWAASGVLPAFRAGRLWRFNAEDIRKLIETPKGRKTTRPDPGLEAKIRRFEERLGIGPVNRWLLLDDPLGPPTKQKQSPRRAPPCN